MLGRAGVPWISQELVYPPSWGGRAGWAWVPGRTGLRSGPGREGCRGQQGGVVRVHLIGGGLAVALLLVGWLVYGVAADDTDPPDVTRPPQLVVTDSSGRGNHGIMQGSPLLGQPGRFGTAYSFDVDGSWIQVPSKRALNPGVRDFMISGWVNLADAPGAGQTFDVFRKGLSYTRGGRYKLKILPEGRVKCSVKDWRGRTGWVLDRADVTDGQWHHVACALTGSVWSVVVDGRVSSKAVDLAAIRNDMALSIGSKYGSEDMLPLGLVDEVRLVVGDGPPASPQGPEAVAEAITRLRGLRPIGLWHLDEQAASG